MASVGDWKFTYRPGPSSRVRAKAWARSPASASPAVQRGLRRQSCAAPTVSVMMCVELTFTADPRRLQARPAHRQRLAQLHHDGVLIAAGPWADDSGALLIFRLDEQGIRAELDTDPYYVTPGVAVASVREWTPVAGEITSEGESR